LSVELYSGSSSPSLTWMGSVVSIAPQLTMIAKFALWALMTDRVLAAPVCFPSLQRVREISDRVRDVLAQRFPSPFFFGKGTFDQVYDLLESGKWSALPAPQELAHLTNRNGAGLLEIAAQKNNTQLYGELLARRVCVHEDFLNSIASAAELGLGDIVDIAWEEAGCLIFAFGSGANNPVALRLAWNFCQLGEFYFNQGSMVRSKRYFSRAQEFFSHFSNRVQHPKILSPLKVNNPLTQEVRVQAVYMNYFARPKSKKSIKMLSQVVVSIGKEGSGAGLLIIADVIHVLGKSGQCVPKQFVQSKKELLALQAEGISRWIKQAAACRVEVQLPFSEELLVDARCMELAMTEIANYFIPFSKVADFMTDGLLPQLDQVVPLPKTGLKVKNAVSEKVLPQINRVVPVYRIASWADYVHKEANSRITYVYVSGRNWWNEESSIKTADFKDKDWVGETACETGYRNFLSKISSWSQDQLDSYLFNLEDTTNPCTDNYYKEDTPH